MAINADWHRANPMPKHPTIDQRITWAIAHAEACGCRDIPAKLRAEMESRGIVPPPRARGERDTSAELGRPPPPRRRG